MESISEQPESALGGGQSVLVRQRRDHERLAALMRTVRTTSGAEQDEALMRMCRLVFTHAFAEEAVLWPTLRRVLPDGEALTLEVEQEHQEITEVVSALDRSRPGDAGREELIERALALLDQDVRDEEDELFPRLLAAVDQNELRRLGWTWEAVRRTAPTRPHAVVARRPPGNVLAALPLSAIDRTRDFLDRLERTAPEPLARGGRAASGALGALAGAVERLPPLRRGEDPTTRTG